MLDDIEISRFIRTLKGTESQRFELMKQYREMFREKVNLKKFEENISLSIDPIETKLHEIEELIINLYNNAKDSINLWESNPYEFEIKARQAIIKFEELKKAITELGRLYGTLKKLFLEDMKLIRELSTMAQTMGKRGKLAKFEKENVIITEEYKADGRLLNNFENLITGYEKDLITIKRMPSIAKNPIQKDIASLKVLCEGLNYGTQLAWLDVIKKNLIQKKKLWEEFTPKPEESIIKESLEKKPRILYIPKLESIKPAAEVAAHKYAAYVSQGPHGGSISGLEINKQLADIRTISSFPFSELENYNNYLKLAKLIQTGRAKVTKQRILGGYPSLPSVDIVKEAEWMKLLLRRINIIRGTFISFKNMGEWKIDIDRDEMFNFYNKNVDKSFYFFDAHLTLFQQLAFICFVMKNHDILNGIKHIEELEKIQKEPTDVSYYVFFISRVFLQSRPKLELLKHEVESAVA